MKELYKIFYETNSSEFEKEYEKRIRFDSTVRTNLTIKPINQPNTFELYYIPTNSMLEKVCKIYKISSELNQTFRSLPSIAKDQFIFERIVEELFNTNELEGVKSTRKEIAKSVREVKLNKSKKRRFHSMIKSYQGLINGDISIPRAPRDIRTIYDEITEKEIESSELPDGEIFRKEVTYVLKKSGIGKVIHRGITPEEEIISKIKELLMFMNETNDIPSIIKTAISHYYFGYIHPFYDGNGRTSRFISSIYLSEELGEIPAISLSQACNKFTNQYLASFEVSNSLMNRGEMNSFIENFLTIILDALKDMLQELKEKDELLRLAEERIKNDPRLKEKSENHSRFMYFLAQIHFFSHSKSVTVQDIASISNLSTSTVRNIAKDLLNLSLIEQRGIRPANYYIKDQYFET